MDMDEKIAITGIGCRYGDGVSGSRGIWEMLKNNRDCTGPPPDNRFDNPFFFYPGEKKKGKLYTKAGGYLKQNPLMFDRQFFKISPEEANHMDPQVRILLEVVWESLEDAGIPASKLRGSNTGVYMGVTASEYNSLTGVPQSNISQYTNSGTNSCMISNRISYEFDLRGPSFSIDTACSSSLYAVQIACDALRGGVCDTAIAGGVNIILTPSVTIGFCQAGMLSPDGQCKSFDESANGYSRSEGVGSVVLKPLKRAIEDGDRIYAVIRGGALTNDGRTPGIANPSYAAQIDLVDRACAAARVNPLEVAYIEAHGTGTPVGDRTEANAIGEAMGRRRSDDAPPLFIGSIKSNVGHAEGAAGIAGVIKTALSLYHREIPSVVHFKSGNPNINFKDLKLQVPTLMTPWPSRSKLLAGCSSFGFGGANAHIVFEAPPSGQFRNKLNSLSSFTSSESYNMLMLSAKTTDALKQMYLDWTEFLSTLESDHMFQNVLYTANMRTHKHVQRAAFIARSREELLTLLRMKVNGESSDTIIDGKAPEGNAINRTVFVFSGMGTQWWAMARQLMNACPIFSNVIQLLDEYLRKNGAKWSLVYMLSKETAENKIIKDTEISQSCICCVQIGLVELYKHYGIIPSAIIGHSVGEVAAAYTAGLLTMSSAVKIIFKRGHLLRKTSGSGTMAAVLHDVENVKERLESIHTDIDVAAINSPSQIVLSGKMESIKALISKLNEDGIQTRLLKVNNAFHSRQQEILKKEFFKKASFLNNAKSSNEQRPLIPMMSTVNNSYLTLQEANDPDYWWSNIRQQVQFRGAVESVLKDGYNSFLEIGAHPALSPAIKDIIASKTNKPIIHFIAHSLKRPRDISSPANDILNFNISLAQMCVNGYPIDMRPYFDGHNCKVESLPLYPWQRVKCSATTTAADTKLRFPGFCHSLLGEPETSANYSQSTNLRVWKSTIGTDKEPWIADHVVQNSIVFPAAGFIETAIAAHHILFASALSVVIKDLHFDRFLFVSEAGTLVETTTEMESNGRAMFTFSSFNAIEKKWTKHSTMNLKSSINTFEEQTEQKYLSVNNIINRCTGILDKPAFYTNKKQVGFNLGESFMCIEKAHFSPVVDEALIHIRAPDKVVAQSNRFYIHPALLDGILQGMAGIERERTKTLNPNAKPEGRVPRSIEKVHFRKSIFPENVYLHFIITSNGEDVYSDVYIADADTYEVIGKFDKIRFGSVGGRSEYKQLMLLEKKWVPIEMDMKPFDTTGLTLITGYDDVLSAQMNNTLMSVGVQSKIQRFGTTQFEQLDLENEPLSNVIITVKPDNINKIHKISKEEFLEEQSHMATMCINLYKTLSSTRNLSPNVWLITRDGFPATKDDAVDPQHASAFGFGLGVMQEDLNFKLSILDIPSDVDTVAAANWLFEYIWKRDNGQKLVALRNYSNNLTGDFTTYCLRLFVSDSGSFPYKHSSNKWKVEVGQSMKTGRLSLVTCIAAEESKSAQFTTINIESFQLIRPATSETSSTEIHQVALFCGHSEQSKLVMGVCSSRDLLYKVHCNHNDIIDIDSKLPASQIINIVTSYFVPYMVVRDIQPDGTTIVCMTSNEDTRGLAVAQIALELNHNVVVAVKDLSVTNGIHLNSDRSVTIVDGKELMRVLQKQSVGCVIGSEGYVREILKSNRGMKEKMRPFATIEMLDSYKHVCRKNNLGLPVNARVVIKNYELSLIEGFQELKPFIKKLLHIFEKPSLVYPVPDVIPRTISLKEVETQDNTSLSNVTFSVDSNDVPVNYSFAGGEIKFSMQESYIVTGGTKGFGLCLVEWLANNGAGSVAILSRSVADAYAEKKLACLRKRGTKIVHIKTDITDRSDVERAFETVVNDLSKSLSGIFHCAAQYDDRLLKDTTQEDWKKVIAAKSWGALLLHQTSTKFNVQLKYFVMISSLVQLIGNTGQANYCAANTYLSSLGHFRRSKGLAATVLCPGIIRDTGFAARKAELVDYWERRGVGSLKAVQVLDGLGVILLCSVSEIGICGQFRVNDFIIEHRGLLKNYTSGTDRRGLIEVGFSSSNSLNASEDESNLNHLKPEEAKSFIFQTLCGIISKRVGLTSEISPDSSPSSIGVDSLMSTELSGDIQKLFAVPFSPMELMNANVTIQALSMLIYKRFLAKGNFEGHENNEEDEEDMSWKAWFILDEKVTSPEIQLICFPPNGGGPSVYARWQEKMRKYKVQLIMAQLPGWEGRYLEKPLQTIEEITSQLSGHLVPRLIPGRFVLFGHSLGGLIAFEVAHLLKERGLHPAHVIISSWYAPTLGYPNVIELEKAPSALRQMEQDIKNKIPLTDNKSLRLSFLDDNLLANAELMRRLIPCFRVGFKICQKYSNTHKTKLQCGMTVFGARSDRFVSPTFLDDWRLEIEPSRSFKKILFSGGHMHVTSANKKFILELQIALKSAFSA
ncbi:mycolipanoate synthase-like [Anneissia japonica]|uniref:mycolipanoate synthase-like n=1 Tax=Anneissia japonica TaxID=1529436 RepID=UPI0014254C65|nr:mycolipanoate synthase-like [Anneissia japonica]